MKGGGPNNDRPSPPASPKEKTKTRPDVFFPRLDYKLGQSQDLNPEP